MWETHAENKTLEQEAGEQGLCPVTRLQLPVRGQTGNKKGENMIGIKDNTLDKSC